MYIGLFLFDKFMVQNPVYKLALLHYSIVLLLLHCTCICILLLIILLTLYIVSLFNSILIGILNTHFVFIHICCYSDFFLLQWPTCLHIHVYIVEL